MSSSFGSLMTFRVDLLQVTTGDTPYTSAATFEDLKLSPELLKGLYVEMKFHKPSKIQAISLPMILTAPFNHLIAQARNGSGKTTCFVLGMLSRVDPNLKMPQALCICPTRELAIQVRLLLLSYCCCFIFFLPQCLDWSIEDSGEGFEILKNLRHFRWKICAFQHLQIYHQFLIMLLET